MYKSAYKYLIICVLYASTGCEQKKESKPEIKPEIRNIFVSDGIACWYGKAFEGRKTASGDIFRREKFTAANRILEFGTLIRVTDIQSAKSVVVEINDRGPYSKARLLDLSERAAKEIGLIKKGSSRVSVEICGYNQVNFESVLKHYNNIKQIHIKNSDK